MATFRAVEWPLLLPEGAHVMTRLLWLCPRCGTNQLADEVQTVEIIEPGKEARIEFHGRIRPSYFLLDGVSWIVYDCLVCGYSWDNLPEDPTPPGGASIRFLHPITEEDEDNLIRNAC
jgi:rubredoxin